MAITLESVAAPGATPIANNAASAKSFANNYYKLAVPNLSTQDRKTIMILGMVHVLAATGANYKSNHAGLIQDAQVYTGGIPMLDVFTALTATTWSAGKATDATFSADVPTLLGEGRDIADLPEDKLDRIISFLAAQLGI